MKTGRRRLRRVHRAILGLVVAATLPHCHPARGLASNADGSGSISTDTQATGESFDERLIHLAGADTGGAKSNAASGGSGSLLDKYTYRETVKTVIEEDQLPELPLFLEGIGLGDRIEDFYRKSVFETKYLFTLNDMDLRLMGLSAEEITTVKESASEIRVERDVTEERQHPLLQKRNGLTYGRLFIDRSASSFEFYLAGFGPPAPVDEARLVWAEPRDACGTLTNSGSLSGMIVLAERGRCSFVDKANTVATSNALALVIINNGADGEDLFRVAATLGGRSGGGEEPKGPENMPTVLVRGSTLPSLSKALEWGAEGDGSVKARLVPLDCKPGRAACEAVLPEEQQAQLQVDSGKIVVSVCAPPEKVPSSLQPSSVDATAEGGVPNASLAFDFLSATFGATLPRGHVTIVPSLPEDACSPLAPLDGRAEMKGEEIGGDVGGYGGGDGPAVLVKRGGCSFGVKAKNVQDAGGRMIIFQDNGLGVLQNVGAPDPLAKELYIPGVFVTARAGDELVAAATTPKDGTENDDPQRIADGRYGAGGLTVRFETDNAVGKAWGTLGATAWPEDILGARVLARQLRATHAASPCRWNWVEGKLQQVEGGTVSSDKSSAETAPKTATRTKAAAAVAEVTTSNEENKEKAGGAVKHEQSSKKEVPERAHRRRDSEDMEGSGDSVGHDGVSSGARGEQDRGGGGRRREKAGRRGSLKEL